MRVLHIISSLDRNAGGPSRSVPQTCEQLAEIGVDITLISGRSEDPVKITQSDNLRVLFKNLFQLIVFGLRISNKGVFLIHLQHTWNPYIHVMARIAQIKNIPYIITPRGMLEPWILSYNPIKKQLGMWLYQRQDLNKAVVLHSTCEMEKENIRKLGFTNPIALIPNGIDLRTIPEYAKVYGTKKIVFFSRIHPKKGIEMLLKAWQQINTGEWILEIAGEGNIVYVSEIKMYIERARIKNVHFAGPKYGAEKWDFLRGADVMVLPTYSENFGMAVVEALAMQVPVITTKGTPWQELETNRCGWWIDLSIANLSSALRSAMSCTPDELKAMGQRGKQLVERQYDIHIVAKQLNELYDWIAGKQGLPAFVSEIDKAERDSNEIKVLHFLTSIDKLAGGTTNYLQLLINPLSEMAEVVVVTGISAQPESIPGAKICFVDLSLARWIAMQHDFARLLQKEQPDLVHLNGIWNPQVWLFQREAQRLGIKTVLSPHGMLEPWILSRHPLKKKASLFLYQDGSVKRADYLHATAQQELDNIRKLGYGQEAVIIPNGIDISAVKEKREWGNKVKKILYLSRVHPKKGIELLIEAVSRLKETELEITIAGEGDALYIESLKKIALKKGVNRYFHFMGGVYGTAKWELYHNADLFVLPTHSENFGIVIAEALATGIPVITTTGTPWQELQTCRCGWWIDLNVDNLKDAIEEAIHTPIQELKAMGQRGRKLVEEKYEIQAVAKDMLKFYQQIKMGADITN